MTCAPAAGRDAAECRRAAGGDNHAACAAADDWPRLRGHRRAACVHRVHRTRAPDMMNQFLSEGGNDGSQWDYWVYEDQVVTFTPRQTPDVPDYLIPFDEPGDLG